MADSVPCGVVVVRRNLEMVGLVSLIPIFAYEGRKVTANKWIQRGFYLFYPLHLLVLWILEVLIYG